MVGWCQPGRIWAWLALFAAAAPFSRAAPSPSALLSEAKRLCYHIKSAQSRAAAFAELAARYDAIGSTGDADKFWQLAQECALSVDDPLARVLSQRAVLARMLKVALRRDQATRLAHDVIAAASKLRIPVDRALALREAGLTVAPVFPDMAKSALQAAAKAADEIPEPLVRVSALSQTAEAMKSIDLDPSKALAAALKSWQTAKPSLERDLAAVELVKALAPAQPAKAREIIQAISDVQVKARALTAMAKALASTDIAQALLAVRAIANPGLRALGLAAVAAKIAATQPQLAARLAQDALHASANAAKPIRELILQNAAPALALTDADAAAKLIAQISDQQERAAAAVAAARLLAPRNVEAAVKLMRSVDAPEVTEPAWPEVLYWYAKKSPDDAYKIAGGILERYLRLRALLRIWDALTEKAKGSARQKQNVAGEGKSKNQP